MRNISAMPTRTPITIEPATFAMGSDDDVGYPGDREGPVREVQVERFALDATATTNHQFAEFVEATGYQTTATNEGWSFVFGGLLPDEFEPTRGVASAPWWRQVFGADWRRPHGPDSTLDGRDDHPVVHVSWHDAVAYATWRGGRLPTEVEWECAARGGLVQKRFPWGDDETPAGEHRCNVWQGEFPTNNTLDDGWYDTAPVDTYAPNNFGLYNMVGNVWEWCDSWFDEAQPVARVMRGGSFLCNPSYCFRYRNSARSSNTPDSSTGNLGVRVAYDV